MFEITLPNRFAARQPAARSGIALVLFAMLLFAIMAIAAIVIDLGMVRLTRTQMKNATSAAALEAYSLSNVAPDDRSTFVMPSVSTDIDMRQAAVDHVSYTFDDDFDLAGDAYQFGAGPVVDFSGGVSVGGEIGASELLSLRASPVAKPTLQLNTDNAPTGDVIITDGSVRVQMQRNSSGETAGENWNGGSVAFLFGRGVVRSVGLTLSSTVSHQPVVAVGAKQLGPPVIAGSIPFAIRLAAWNAMPQNTVNSMALDSMGGGSLTHAATVIGQQVMILTTPPTPNSGYVAVVNDADIVIGFGWADVSPFDASSVTVTKHAGASSNAVAAENATSRLSAAWDSLSMLDATTRQSVIDANRSFSDPLVVGVLED